jgi:hypothetical protein
MKLSFTTPRQFYRRTGDHNMIHITPVRNLILRTLRSKSVYIVAAFALTLCAVGLSQSTAGSIDGILTDQSGAALPNATVTVTNESTGAVRVVVTNAAGVYSLPNLSPGNYRAVITATGFAALNTELVVPINRPIRWDAALKTGNVSTTITVTDAAAQIETDSHQLDETIEADDIEALPSDGRTLFSVLTYSTGVAGYPGNDSNDIDYFHQQANSLTIGGSVFGATGYSQDGVMNVNMLTRTANYQPSIEAAQEVSIIRNGASARFDAPNVVNVVTKSGANAFHGTIYDFLRNDAFNAIGEIKVKKQPLRYNQFGANIGGPILHDRLFFFFDYGGLRQHNSAISNGVIPTLAERNGDFSALSTPIYDPATYNASTGSISQFPGNIIPASRITDFANKILAFFPAPTASAITGTNFQKVLESSVNRDSYLGRLDYVIGKQDKIYGAYMTTNPVTIAEQIFTTPVFNPSYESHAKNAYIEETHIFNPQMVNVFRVGYNRSVIFNTVAGVGTQGPLDYGLTALAGTPPSQWLPPGISFGTGGYTGWNPSVQGATQNLFQYSDELSFTHGRHTIFAGAELERSPFNGTWVLANNGRFFFNCQYTSNHALKQSGGNAIADLLLGFPNQATGAIGSTVAAFRQYNVMPYLQDDWRVSKKLTLNMGIRYDYYGAPADKNGHSNVYDVETNTNHPGSFRQTYNDWAPRVGFAYSLRPTTSFRGGYGIYFAGIQYNELQFMMANQPNFYAENNSYTAAQAVPVANTLTAHPAASSQAPYTVALHMPSPYVQERNLSIQQSFGSRTVAQVDYVGSNALHMMRRINANQAYLPANPSAPASLQARRPYQWVGDVLEASDSGYANYNAVEGSVRGNFGYKSTVFASAIYSKALDDASSEQDVPQNLYDLGAEYGLSSFNRKYVVKVGGQTQVPILGRHNTLIRTNNGFLNTAFGGWMISGVVQVLSGLPLTVNASDSSNTGAFHPARANRSCDAMDFPGRSQKKWFNTACYSQPQVYQFGSAPRNDIIGPKFTQTSMSAFKSFAFGERRAAIVRVDAFDPFNESWLTNPTLTQSSPSFGVAGIGGARILQVSMKVAF